MEIIAVTCAVLLVILSCAVVVFFGLALFSIYKQFSEEEGEQ